jgi:hypothetical protein
MCDALEALAMERDKHIETARQTEWTLVHGLPSTIDACYPEHLLPPKEAYALRQQWIACITGAQQTFPGSDDWYAIAAEGRDYTVRLTPKDPDWDAAAARRGERQEKPMHFTGFNAYYLFDADGRRRSDLDRQVLAVGLYRYIYDRNVSPKADEAGFTETYKDGLPDCVLRDLFAAYEDAGLTGLVAYVKLDPRAARRLERTSSATPVTLVTGMDATWVLERQNGLKVGTLPARLDIPEGSYLMSPKGVIVVRESDQSLHSRFTVDRAAKRAAGADDEFGADFGDDDNPYAR